MNGIENLCEGESEDMRKFFDNQKEEFLKLVNDYLNNYCVEFKKEDLERQFKNGIETKFEQIIHELNAQVNPKTVINEENKEIKYSNSSNHPYSSNLFSNNSSSNVFSTDNS